MAQDVSFNAPFRNSVNTDHKEQCFHKRYFCEVFLLLNTVKFLMWPICYLPLYIQGVTGGMCETSGECSLGHTIPI